MQAIPVEPISPLNNPTSIALSANTTIPSTSRYIVRVTASSAGLTLFGRTGMSNLIQNEGSHSFEVAPISGADVTLPPGYEMRLTWDRSQNKHEVQPPTVGGGTVVLDNTVTAGSSNGVKSSGIDQYVKASLGGTVVKASGISATDTAAMLAAALATPKNILVDDSVAPLTLGGGGIVDMKDKVVSPLSGATFNVRLTNSTFLQFGEYLSPVTQTTNWHSFTMTADKSTITSAGLTNVAVGDVLVFGSTNAITENAPHFAAGTQYPIETAVVKVISGSTYTLDTQLVDTYTTNPKVALLSKTGASGSVKKLAVDCGIRGANFAGSDQSGNAVLFACCLRPFANNILLENSGQVQFALCNKPKADNVEIPRQKLGNSDYGIAVVCSDEGEFSNIRAGSCRHAYTTGGFGSGLIRYGTNRRNTVRDSIAIPDGLDASGTSNIAWDQHSESYGQKYLNVRVILTAPSTVSPSAGASMIGFGDRGRHTEYHNCHVVGNKTSLHRGWLISSAYNTSFYDCTMNGGWAAILTESSGVPAPGGELPANQVKVYGGTFRNLRNEAMIFNGGAGHRVYGAKIYDVGESASGLWGSVRAAIAFADTDSLGLSDCAVEGVIAPKTTNLYSVGIDTLDEAAIVLRDNDFKGYGHASIGINRALTTAPQVEATWGNSQRNRPRYLYANDTAHGYTTGTHLYRPLDLNINIYDDTAAYVESVGVLVDVINADWLVLAQPGQEIEVPTTMLSGSYSIAADGRKLWWDASLAKYVKTKPGDSHASAPVALHVLSVIGTALKCRLVLS